MLSRWKLFFSAATSTALILLLHLTHSNHGANTHSGLREGIPRIDRLPKDITNHLDFNTAIDDPYWTLTMRVTDYFESVPVPITNFAEMAHRLRILLLWIELAEHSSPGTEAGLWSNIERVGQTLFPFVRHPEFSWPFHTAFNTHKNGTSGIVIVAGRKDFQFACHLIANIQDVHQSTLPIVIAYAGDADLSSETRDFILSIFPAVTFLDIFDRFSDETLLLNTGRWAIKPFAALASPFQHTILLDADVVFLQDPSTILASPGYLERGSTLYKDRLIWPHIDRFHKDEWWQAQLNHLYMSPMAQFFQDRAYQEGFSEHGESGVIALDKGRSDVRMALFHAAWQNTYNVRKDVTYEHANGDKESYWFAFEALRVPYTIEKHYGSALGTRCAEPDVDAVCTQLIAHVDHEDNLLWWNGGLLRDKGIDASGYNSPPTVWMRDGTWTPADPGSLSTMAGAEVRLVMENEAEVVSESISRAKQIDAKVKSAFPDWHDARFDDPT